MYTAEDTLTSIESSEIWEKNNLDAKNRHGLGDILQPSNPSAESSQGSQSSAPPFPPFNVTTSFKTSLPSGTPLVVPPSLLSNTTGETDKSAVDDLRLVKAQVSELASAIPLPAVTCPTRSLSPCKVPSWSESMMEWLIN